MTIENKKQQDREICSALRSASSNINMTLENMIINGRPTMTSLREAKAYIQEAIDHANGHYHYD